MSAMLSSALSYQRDIYTCVNCQQWISKNDQFCRNCRHEFSNLDVNNMQLYVDKNGYDQAPYLGKFDEQYKCSICNGVIALDDHFCRHCSLEITEINRQIIAGNTDPDNLNTWVISTVIIIVLVIFFLLLTV